MQIVLAFLGFAGLVAAFVIVLALMVLGGVR